MKESPTGNNFKVGKLDLSKKTDKIGAKKGLTFGVDYVLKSKDIGFVNVEIEWIYPEEIVNDKGEKFEKVRYNIRKQTNRRDFSTYTFEEDYEIIKGEWQFSIYYKSKKLYERIFYVE